MLVQKLYSNASCAFTAIVICMSNMRYFGGALWRAKIDPVKGTIRLDVVKGPVAAPKKSWDYKFGDARLTGKRITEIRGELDLGSRRANYKD